MADEARMTWDGHETWYRVVGELGRRPDAGRHLPRRPRRRARLHRADRRAERGSAAACVLYDQLGCGKSKHLPDAPADFWTPQLFKDELAALTRAARDRRPLRRRRPVVGRHARDGVRARPPAGLRAIVVADSPASIPLWVEEANRLRRDLPADVQETLTQHEAAGTTDDPEYEAAVRVFYDRHLCRVPWPDCVERSFAQIADDPTVYHTMNGPSEFHCIGSLKDWDITDRLHEITTPTLLVSGRYDEATPHIVEQIHARIPGAQWRAFEESSHMPHVEEPEAFLEAVEEFLQTID